MSVYPSRRSKSYWQVKLPDDGLPQLGHEGQNFTHGITYHIVGAKTGDKDLNTSGNRILNNYSKITNQGQGARAKCQRQLNLRDGARSVVCFALGLTHMFFTLQVLLTKVEKFKKLLLQFPYTLKFMIYNLKFVQSILILVESLSLRRQILKSFSFQYYLHLVSQYFIRLS